MIDGNTEVIAHVGYPTHTFKSPMIYNPWFEREGINAIVVPMAVKPEDYAGVLASLFRLGNIRGALITMPHKVTTTRLVDTLTPTAQIAGAVNGVKRDDDGRLLGDMFDGEGFVRGVRRKGLELAGAKALVVGCGGVGSAIAASLAAAGVALLRLHDTHGASADALAGRLRTHYPALQVQTGSNDPAGMQLAVNATPLGMNEGDPLPLDIARLDAATFVGEVVMRQETTAFLKAAQQRGCRVQVGTDMLFEQIPAYLEFFGFPSTTAEQLRSVARVAY